MKENIDYELISSKKDDNSWNIRFLNGLYTETVVQIGTITLNDEPPEDNGDHHMSFDFSVIYSPDAELTSEDVDLQDIVGDTILSIIERSIAREQGSVLTSVK